MKNVQSLPDPLKRVICVRCRISSPVSMMLAGEPPTCANGIACRKRAKRNADAKAAEDARKEAIAKRAAGAKGKR